MAELDSIHAAIIQAAIQRVTVVVMALKEADIGPTTGIVMPNTGGALRPRYDRLALDNHSI